VEINCCVPEDNTLIKTQSICSLVRPSLNSTVGPPSFSLIADTGSTAHFGTTDLPVLNKRPASTPLAIRNPNGNIMYSTHVAELDLPLLPLAARQVHIVPDLTAHTLVSIGLLCDAGCDVTFNASDVTVQYNQVTVLQGKRTATTGLWHFAMPTPAPTSPPVPCAHAMSAIGSATPAELVAFAHAALFSPALSTLAIALQKGFVQNFPGLTVPALKKYPPRSFAMVKGHLDQARKNQKSTTKNLPPLDPPDTSDDFPSISTEARSHFCYASIIEPTGQIYSDQTGKFVQASSTGNNYLFILYEYDSNLILAEPMKTRSAQSILTAYKTVHAQLCRSGLRPQLQRLDNECSAALKDYMREEHIDFQLVPPGSHRRNAAERAIRTFKNHFIAGLCSVDKNFPLHLWDRLVPQAVITLNLLRGSRLNPKLSAWSYFHGNFDFNRTPLAPPGIRVLAHEKPADRETWSPHGLDGWYVGPALDSYRCFTVWMWDTRRERICDTVSWFPTKVTMPLASSTDLVLAGIQDIVHALTYPSHNSPLALRTDSQVQALLDLTTLLTNIVAPASPSAPPLRVEPAQTKPSDPIVPPPSAPPQRVEPPPGFSPLPAPLPPTPPPLAPATYDNSTGAKGRRRRKLARRPAKPAVPGPLPVPPSTHSHGTRANAKKQPHLAATTTFHTDAYHCALHSTAINPDTGHTAEYRELRACSDGDKWINSCADEIGRLCNGRGPNSAMTSGTNTLFFIPLSAMPKGRKATYIRIVCADRPEKTETRRVRFTVGGDQVDYPGAVSTKTADLATAKLLINSVLSTPGARYMTGDLKDFYLNTPMERYEYVRIPIDIIPDISIIEHNLLPLVHNGFVYAECRKGMYGLPQAGRIANDRLVAFLAPHGYEPVPITPGLWRHSKSDLAFTLVVDDFGIKYTNKQDVTTFMDILNLLYKVSEDWAGARYCGLTLDWDYDKRTCDISMPGYIDRALQRFSHPTPSKPQHSPHAWQKPTYGTKVQYAPDPDSSPALDASDIKRVQEVLGTLLYYARAVDSTMLAAIGSIATQQTNGTQATMKAVTQLLNYCATHPDAVVRYFASDMILEIDSDASYLSAPKARSRAAGYHTLGYLPAPVTDPPTPARPRNGAINVLCTIMREVVSSAAEAELAALFHNGKEACPLRIALEELGHIQPATPIHTDNSTASGIANDTVKQKRSKAIDMRFYWIRDRVRQGQFVIYWKKGSLNRADYFTKHHATTHHQAIRSAYLHEPNGSPNYFDCLTEDDENDPPKKTVTFSPDV
jgi:hypothetical protein